MTHLPPPSSPPQPFTHPKYLSLILLLLMTCCTDLLSGLQCFDCGLYIPPERLDLQPGTASGKIYPCTNLTLSHLKECKESERFCMKYVNGGLEVRLCSENCVEDVHSYSEREIHCCDDDACNRASIPTTMSSFLIPTVSLISLILTTVYSFAA